MAKAIWSGSLSFGLVNIPVRLYNATSPRDVRFHQFQRGTGRRIRYRRVTEEFEPQPPRWEMPPSPVDEPRAELEPPPPPQHTGERERGGFEPPPPAQRPREPEVAYEDVVKGFEIDRDRYVMVTPEELRELEPERSQAMEIEGFIDLADIDPVSFEKSYYLAPQRGVGAEGPYALLLEALTESNKVGVARFVMRTKEYLAAIRPMDGILGLETLFYADEVRSAAEIDNVPEPAEVPERELGMALQFIELLAMDWDPSRYRDTYRERVLELLRRRAEEEGTVETVPADEAAAVPAMPDLMAALRASVEAAKERAGDDRPRKRTRRTGTG